MYYVNPLVQGEVWRQCNCKLPIQSMQSNFVLTSIVRSKYHNPAPEVIKHLFLLWLLPYEYLDRDSELHDICIKEEERNFQVHETVNVIQW